MPRHASLALALLTLALAGCSGAPTRVGVTQDPSAPVPAAAAQSAPAVALKDASRNGADSAPLAQMPEVSQAPEVSVRTAEKVQRGLASWYGQAFNGQHTASGRRFDMHALTAAHPKLPLGSYARVTLLSTGKSVVVHITDRGPYAAHRIIDVSRAAAARLGLLRRGVGEVAVQPVARPDQIASAN